MWKIDSVLCKNMRNNYMCTRPKTKSKHHFIRNFSGNVADLVYIYFSKTKPWPLWTLWTFHMQSFKFSHWTLSHTTLFNETSYHYPFYTKTFLTFQYVTSQKAKSELQLFVSFISPHFTRRDKSKSYLSDKFDKFFRFCTENDANLLHTNVEEFTLANIFVIGLTCYITNS